MLKVCLMFAMSLVIIYILAFFMAAIKTKRQNGKVPLIYKRIFYIALSVVLLLSCVGVKLGMW